MWEQVDCERWWSAPMPRWPSNTINECCRAPPGRERWSSMRRPWPRWLSPWPNGPSPSVAPSPAWVSPTNGHQPSFGTPSPECPWGPASAGRISAPPECVSCWGPRASRWPPMRRPPSWPICLIPTMPVEYVICDSAPWTPGWCGTCRTARSMSPTPPMPPSPVSPGSVRTGWNGTQPCWPRCGSLPP